MTYGIQVIIVKNTTNDFLKNVCYLKFKIVNPVNLIWMLIVTLIVYKLNIWILICPVELCTYEQDIGIPYTKS